MQSYFNAMNVKRGANDAELKDLERTSDGINAALLKGTYTLTTIQDAFKRLFESINAYLKKNCTEGLDIKWTISDETGILQCNEPPDYLLRFLKKQSVVGISNTTPSKLPGDKRQTLEKLKTIYTQVQYVRELEKKCFKDKVESKLDTQMGILEVQKTRIEKVKTPEELTRLREQISTENVAQIKEAVKAFKNKLVNGQTLSPQEDRNLNVEYNESNMNFTIRANAYKKLAWKFQAKKIDESNKELQAADKTVIEESNRLFNTYDAQLSIEDVVHTLRQKKGRAKRRETRERVQLLQNMLLALGGKLEVDTFSKLARSINSADPVYERVHAWLKMITTRTLQVPPVRSEQDIWDTEVTFNVSNESELFQNFENAQQAFEAVPEYSASVECIKNLRVIATALLYFDIENDQTYDNTIAANACLAETIKFVDHLTFDDTSWAADDENGWQSFKADIEVTIPQQVQAINNRSAKNLRAAMQKQAEELAEEKRWLNTVGKFVFFPDHTPQEMNGKLNASARYEILTGTIAIFAICAKNFDWFDNAFQAILNEMALGIKDVVTEERHNKTIYDVLRAMAGKTDNEDGDVDAKDIVLNLHYQMCIRILSRAADNSAKFTKMLSKYLDMGHETKDMREARMNMMQNEFQEGAAPSGAKKGTVRPKPKSAMVTDTVVHKPTPQSSHRPTTVTGSDANESGDKGSSSDGESIGSNDADATNAPNSDEEADYKKMFYLFDDDFDNYNWNVENPAHRNGVFMMSNASAIPTTISTSKDDNTAFTEQMAIFVAHLKTKGVHTIARTAHSYSPDYVSNEPLKNISVNTDTFYRAYSQRRNGTCTYDAVHEEVDGEDNNFILVDTNNEEVYSNDLDGKLINCVQNFWNTSSRDEQETVVDCEYVGITADPNVCFLGLWVPDSDNHSGGRLYHLQKMFCQAKRTTDPESGHITAVTPKNVWYDFMCAADVEEHTKDMTRYQMLNNRWQEGNSKQFFADGTLFDCLIGQYDNYAKDKEGKYVPAPDPVNKKEYAKWIEITHHPQIKTAYGGNYTFANQDDDITLNADAFNAYLVNIGFANVVVTNEEITACLTKCHDVDGSRKHDAIDELMLLCTLRHCKNKYPDSQLAFRASMDDNATETIATHVNTTKPLDVKLPDIASHFGSLPQAKVDGAYVPLANCNVGNGTTLYLDRYTGAEMEKKADLIVNSNHFTTRSLKLNLPNTREESHITVMHSDSTVLLKAFLEKVAPDEEDDDAIIVDLEIAKLIATKAIECEEPTEQRTLLLYFIDIMCSNEHWQDQMRASFSDENEFNRLFMSLPNKYYWADICQRLLDEQNHNAALEDPHFYNKRFVDLIECVNEGLVTQQGFKSDAPYALLLRVLQQCNLNIELLPPWMLLRLSNAKHIEISGMTPEAQIDFYTAVKAAQPHTCNLLGAKNICNHVDCYKVLTRAETYTDFQVVNAQRNFQPKVFCLCKDHAAEFITQFEAAAKSSASEKGVVAMHTFGGTMDLELQKPPKKKVTRLDKTIITALPSLIADLSYKTVDCRWQKGSSDSFSNAELLPSGIVKVTPTTEESSFAHCYLNMSKTDYLSTKDKGAESTCTLIYTSFDLLDVHQTVQHYVANVPTLAAAQIVRLEQCAINYNFLADVVQRVDDKLQEKIAEKQSNHSQSNLEVHIDASIQYLRKEKSNLQGHNRYAFPNVNDNDYLCSTPFKSFKLEKGFDTYRDAILQGLHIADSKVEELEIGVDAFYKTSATNFDDSNRRRIADVLTQVKRTPSTHFSRFFKKFVTDELDDYTDFFFQEIPAEGDKIMQAITEHFDGSWHPPIDVLLADLSSHQETDNPTPNHFFMLSANKTQILVHEPTDAGHPLATHAKQIHHCDVVTHIGTTEIAPADIANQLAILNNPTRGAISISVKPRVNETALHERYCDLIDQVFDYKVAGANQWGPKRFAYCLHFHQSFNAQYYPLLTLSSTIRNNERVEKYRYQSYIPISWQEKRGDQSVAEMWDDLANAVAQQYKAVQGWYDVEPETIISDNFEMAPSADESASSATLNLYDNATRAAQNYLLTRDALTNWATQNAKKSTFLSVNNTNCCLASHLLQQDFFYALKRTWLALCTCASEAHKEVFAKWYLKEGTTNLRAYNVDFNGASEYYRGTEHLPKLDLSFKEHPLHIAKPKMWQKAMPPTYTKLIIDDIVNFSAAVLQNDSVFYALEATFNNKWLNADNADIQEPIITCKYAVYHPSLEITQHYATYTRVKQAIADRAKLNESLTSAAAELNEQVKYSTAYAQLETALKTIEAMREPDAIAKEELAVVATELKDWDPQVKLDGDTVTFDVAHKDQISALMKTLGEKTAVVAVHTTKVSKKRSRNAEKLPTPPSEPTPIDPGVMKTIMGREDKDGNSMHEDIATLNTIANMYKRLHDLEGAQTSINVTDAYEVASHLSSALYKVKEPLKKPKIFKGKLRRNTKRKNFALIDPETQQQLVAAFINAKLQSAVFDLTRVQLSVLQSIDIALAGRLFPFTEANATVDLTESHKRQIREHFENFEKSMLHVKSDAVMDFLEFLLQTKTYNATSLHKPDELLQHMLVTVCEQAAETNGNSNITPTMMTQLATDSDFLPKFPLDFVAKLTDISKWPGFLSSSAQAPAAPHTVPSPPQDGRSKKAKKAKDICKNVSLVKTGDAEAMNSSSKGLVVVQYITCQWERFSDAPGVGECPVTIDNIRDFMLWLSQNKKYTDIAWANKAPVENNKDRFDLAYSWFLSIYERIVRDMLDDQIADDDYHLQAAVVLEKSKGIPEWNTIPFEWTPDTVKDIQNEFKAHVAAGKRKPKRKVKTGASKTQPTKLAELVANRDAAKQLYDAALLAAVNDSTKDVERDTREAELIEARRLLAAYNRETADTSKKKKKKK